MHYSCSHRKTDLVECRQPDHDGNHVCSPIEYHVQHVCSLCFNEQLLLLIPDLPHVTETILTYDENVILEQLSRNAIVPAGEDIHAMMKAYVRLTHCRQQIRHANHAVHLLQGIDDERVRCTAVICNLPRASFRCLNAYEKYYVLSALTDGYASRYLGDSSLDQAERALCLSNQRDIQERIWKIEWEVVMNERSSRAGRASKRFDRYRMEQHLSAVRGLVDEINHQDLADDEKRCPICDEDMYMKTQHDKILVNETAVRLRGCKSHQYGLSCLGTWFYESKTCPTCRKSYEVEYNCSVEEYMGINPPPLLIPRDLTERYLNRRKDGFEGMCIDAFADKQVQRSQRTVQLLQQVEQLRTQ